jgi:hypothetical protein
MSTTADKSVALFYANGRGTVVEISVGRIQIGGDVSFLSMVRPPPPHLMVQRHLVLHREPCFAQSTARPTPSNSALRRAGLEGNMWWTKQDARLY